MNHLQTHLKKRTRILSDAVKNKIKAHGLYPSERSKYSEEKKMDNIELMDRLNENEKIQRKFHELESKILSILNFQDFFEILLTEMGNIFNVPYVWL